MTPPPRNDSGSGRGLTLACTVSDCSETLGELSGHRNKLEGNAVRLTLDSSEPLEDAIRVLGALYGVTLIVSNGQPEASEPTHQPTSRPKRADSTKPRAGAGSAGTQAGKSPERTAPRPAGPPSNAEVRSWARQAGLTVSDRGRVPASVMTSYRSANP
jgi:hypothetical protein